MNYKLIIEKPAQKFIAKQPKPQQKRIFKALKYLPGQGDIKPLQGSKNLFRLRVGSYRIIYTVENEIFTILVLEAGNRGDIYK